MCNIKFKKSIPPGIFQSFWKLRQIMKGLPFDAQSDLWISIKCVIKFLWWKHWRWRWRWWWLWVLLLLLSSLSLSSSRFFSRLFICYTNLTSKSEPSRNQWPKFGVPKERSFVRLTHERFYFYKLDHKINWILLYSRLIVDPLSFIMV